MKALACVRGVWRSRWGLARLVVAAFALWFLLADSAGRLARMQLESLPGMDYAAEVRHLRAAGRYAEAITVADDGLIALKGEARLALEKEKDAAEEERSSVLRRLKDVGMGALSGQGSSVEGLVGAVGADMLVVGDVRDLLLQGGRYVVDGEADEVVLLLSGVGLLTTVAPEIDWAPSLLKIARKTGSMTARLAEHVKTLVKGKKVAELRGLFEGVARLARSSSPGQAIRLLRFAEEPKDIEKLARFVEREKAGAFALHVTGKEGAEMVKAADVPRVAAAATRAADAVLVSAARKGPAGVAWLRTGNARFLLRAHPIVGLVKGLYKGNVERLVERALAATDGRAWWLIPLLAAWVFVEGAVVARRLAGGLVTRDRRGPPVVAHAA